MTDAIEGRAWRFGSDVDTDVIIPSDYMRKPPEEYAKHAMEPVDQDFA
jgi:3-isopropylmalate dehydratase small subunit